MKGSLKNKYREYRILLLHSGYILLACKALSLRSALRCC